MKGIGKGGALIGKAEQILVGNDDQRVDMCLQLLDSFLGLRHAALSLKFKGFGDHANGQNTAFAGGPSDDWRCACACAASHARGDEHHVAISEFSHNVFEAFLCCRLANFRL